MVVIKPIAEESGPRHALIQLFDVSAAVARDAELRNRASAMAKLANDYRGKEAEVQQLNRELLARMAVTAEERQQALHRLAETQQRLTHAVKMEAIGRLSGGIAHDFNNLLTVIASFTRLALDGMSEHEPAYDDLETVLRATDSAQALTRQLLTFSRQQIAKPRIINPNELVVGVGKMLRRIVGEDIEIVTSLATDLHSAEIDPGHFEQLLVNLVVNARDAMPRGGKLTIRTENIHLPEGADQSTLSGDCVLVEVADTGVGMDQAVIARIFEPYFSTKPKGSGTGLGLATCYGLVKQVGGAIEVGSELGAGTKMQVLLPRASPTAIKAIKTAASEHAVLTGDETVLVVEDESEVRRMIARALRGKGYRVLEAPDGAAALVFCKSATHRIDLLLTDVVMPNLSGPELAAEANVLCPGIRVLFMTGYTDERLLEHETVLSEGRLLQKPFLPETLAKRVRQALDYTSSPQQGRKGDC